MSGNVIIMELEVQGVKCKKLEPKKSGLKRALNISLCINNTSSNIQWKSIRPKSSGLITKQKKVDLKPKDFGLNTLFPNIPPRPKKLLSKTPTPLRSGQKRYKKGKVLMYSPKAGDVLIQRSVFSYKPGQLDLGRKLGGSLNIEKMRFSPKQGKFHQKFPLN